MGHQAPIRGGSRCLGRGWPGRKRSQELNPGFALVKGRGSNDANRHQFGSSPEP
jgi:hypothetical protein